MKLQVATRLALYAILQLASDPGRQFSGAEIAERFGISPNHLAKVLRTLGRAGLVEALRGAGGGYRFRGNARRVTLLDVIQLFEDIGSDGDREPGSRSSEGRALRRVTEEIDEIARATAGSITLATMLRLVADHQRGQAPRRDEAPEPQEEAPERLARAVGQLGR